MGPKFARSGTATQPSARRSVRHRSVLKLVGSAAANGEGQPGAGAEFPQIV
jgi:hypothetical protein